jgi:hypothetical protein
MQQYGRAQEVQANAMALRQARSENALAQQTAMTQQKTALEDKAVNKLIAENYDPTTGRVNMNKVMEGAAQLGLGGRLPGMQKEQLETEGKVQDVEAKFASNVKSAMDNAKYRLEGVTTPQQFIQWHEQNHNDPTLKKYFQQLGVTAAQARAQIEAVMDKPAAFAALLQQAQLGLEKAASNVTTQRGQDITARTTERGQDIQASTTRRGQDIGAATARRGQDFQASAIGQVIKNEDGSSTLVNNQGKVVSTLKPASGTKANTSREKLGGTLDQLAGYYNTLKSQGAAVSSESGNPLANIVAGVRGTMAGEAVEGLLGTKAQTARDAIRMTRPMIVASLKEALGLSAQQLNSNKELQLWLDAATDPTKSYEANMDALNNLARVTGTNKTYGASAAQSAPAAGGVLQYDASGKRK